MLQQFDLNPQQIAETQLRVKDGELRVKYDQIQSLQQRVEVSGITIQSIVKIVINLSLHALFQATAKETRHLQQEVARLRESSVRDAPRGQQPQVWKLLCGMHYSFERRDFNIAHPVVLQQ